MIILGYYGAPRVFQCASCGPDGLSNPVETANKGEGLDFARERCAKCGTWVDEDGATHDAIGVDDATTQYERTHMDAKTCRCPLRPYLGGMARDSQMQTAADWRWEQEHGVHPYAKARDRIASAMQAAEAEMGSGEAMWQAAHEVMGLR